MKKIIISLWAIVAGLTTMSCMPDIVAGLDGEAIPNASELDVTISVDQTTNYVTFTLNNPGMIPMWIFSESDVVTDNNLQRRYRNAGTYSVEVKALNRHGVSDASVTKEFIVENDYVVPSHPLFGTGTKRWKIASTLPSHLALGGAYPTEWYNAVPGEKASTGFYDDRITFTQNGEYIYDPGPDGLTFVNGSLLGGGDDGDMEGTRKESTYTFDEDAMTLTLPQGINLPYISHPVQIASSWTYTVGELDDNKLLLSWWIDEQSMFWQIILEPEVRVEKSPLFGNDTKTWKIGSMLPSHLALGGAFPTEWYNAAPEEKATTGFYDDRVTFGEDGSYVYDPGPDGLTFVNGSMNDVADDYDMEGTRKESTYAFDEDAMTLTLPQGINLPYIAHPSQLESSFRYTVAKLETDQLVLTWWIDAQSMFWQIILVPENYTGDEPPPPFDPGTALEPAEFGEMLAGSWTWESSSAGHIGCGESLTNPTGWWNAGPNEKENASLYDDVITFGPGNAYKYDPVDGKTYMNKGVTTFTGEIVDIPYYEADEVTGDFRIVAAVQESTYSFSASGDFPSFTLPASVYFSYIPSDNVFDGTIVYYITAMWENQIEISAAWTDSGIAWRYRLKRVS